MKLRMLSWAKQFSIHIFLDNNEYKSPLDGYECLVAVNTVYQLGTDSRDVLSELTLQHSSKKDWVFGCLTYDYKNVLFPGLKSDNPKTIGFPEASFFIPETVLYISRDFKKLIIESFGNPDEIYGSILSEVPFAPKPLPYLTFESSFTKDEYVDIVEKLRTHIKDGDCYEINFCNSCWCEHAIVDPLSVFSRLNDLSPAPFAAYFRFNDLYLMCASPERYLKKEGRRVLSQPIKGTAGRSTDPATDEQLKLDLRNSIKEQAENVMIVDLVRNDLSRSCEVGSISVDELFGIYTFPRVHQMISTVSGTLLKDGNITDAIKTSFPMGSMTGAPKYKVMQLIERYERTNRELFSGSVGYINPAGDFDFNVVIRSLYYNQTTQRLGYQTGGAITYDSDPLKEWEEMRLKAWAMERIFGA